MIENESYDLISEKNVTSNAPGLLTPEMIHSDLCIRAFERMFWPFLFFIDFRIGMNNIHIDILPDFIGWILIVIALGWIIKLHSDIKFIRSLAYWLVFLSIFDLVEIQIPLKKAGSFTYSISPLFFVGIISAVLTIIVIWKLCGVIMEMADAVNNTIIRDQAEFRRKLYIFFTIFILFFALISFIIPPLILIAVVVGLPLAIVVFCLLMGLMRGTANMCRGQLSHRNNNLDT
jgi:hypothetical protein